MKRLLAIGCFLFSFASFAQHSNIDSAKTDISEVSEVQIFAPNAFTPDGDFNNDTWQVFMQGIDIYDFQLMIFDRTGDLIWESYDIDSAWDGTFGGYSAPDGIYPWVVQARDAETDEITQFKGFITLLR